MKTTLIGNIGEDFAVKILKDKGYKILERNAKYADCEIDVICECYVDENDNLIGQSKVKFSNLLEKLHFKNNVKGERVIVFCEVKTRQNNFFGEPEEAVTPYKIGRYVTGAKSYLKTHRLTDVRVRFDVIALSEDSIKHIENAFSANDALYIH